MKTPETSTIVPSMLGVPSPPPLPLSPLMLDILQPSWTTASSKANLLLLSAASDNDLIACQKACPRTSMLSVWLLATNSPYPISARSTSCKSGFFFFLSLFLKFVHNLNKLSDRDSWLLCIDEYAMFIFAFLITLKIHI